MSGVRGGGLPNAATLQNAMPTIRDETTFLSFCGIKKNHQWPRAAVTSINIYQHHWERPISIARGAFTSVVDVARKLRRYTNAYSANAKSVRWKYSNPARSICRNEPSSTGRWQQNKGSKILINCFAALGVAVTGRQS